jgi:hypothetical protein
MAEKIYKEKERSALGGFRECTEYSIDGDQFFHGFPIEALGGYPITVDPNFNDQILFEAFKSWLAYIHKELGVKAPKPFGEAELRKWREYQILAVFDLDLWGRLSGSKYLDGVIAKSLWPDDAEEGGPPDPVDVLRRTVRRRVAEVINWKTWHCLYHQVELEEVIIKDMQEP